MEYGVLGASLSAQTVRHDTGEPVGYVEFLRRNHAEQLQTTPLGIRSYAYPGARLFNAGLVRLQDVLVDAPDICIFEPLVEDTSKGRWARPIELQTVYKRLIETGIVPVTFFVGLPEHASVDDFPVTADLRRICRTFGLPLIEADIAAIRDAGAAFSGVHTTAESGPALAAQLADGLAALDLPALRERILSRPMPEAEIHVACAPPPDRSDLRRISIDVTPVRPGPYALRMVMEQSIGPQAPVIRARVVAPDTGEGLQAPQELSVWDPNCHYDRDAFTTLLEETGPFTRPVRVEVEVAGTDPDYASARRGRDHWPGADRRCLRPRGPVAVISDRMTELQVAAVTPLAEAAEPGISARDNPDLSCDRPRSSILSRLRSLWRRRTGGPRGGGTPGS